MPAGLRLPPPPTLDLQEEAGDSGWAELTRVRGDIEAHLVTGRLGESGIEAALVREFGSSAWMYGGSNPFAPVAVLVRKLQLEDARLVLAEIAFEAPAASPAPVTRRRWRFAVLWWTAALVLGLLLTGVSLLRASDALERCSVQATCGTVDGSR